MSGIERNVTKNLKKYKLREKESYNIIQKELKSSYIHKLFEICLKKEIMK